MKFIAPALLLIGLLFALAMSVAIGENVEQKEFANKIEWENTKELQIKTPVITPPLPAEIECDRAYVKGYTKGYRNGVRAYCDTGVDMQDITSSIMCYDIGYDRGFSQGVAYAHQNQTECLKHKPIPEVELDIEPK